MQTGAAVRYLHQIIFVLLGFMVLTISSRAHAVDIWFEPYAGYEIGDKETGNTSYDASGENLGFRLGGLNQSVLFGFEYALATIDVEEQNADDEIKTKDMGIYFGVNLQQIRVWFTYWFDSEGDSDTHNGTYKGDGGYKLGFGIKVFDQVSVNVEKTLRTWDKLDNLNLNGKVQLDGMLISLSLPMTF